VVGWKPIESGVDGAAEGGLGEDEAALAVASAIHAPSVRLRAPLSPHLAARREGVTVDAAALHARWAALAAAWPTLVVEPAGGLCSPLDDVVDNAGWLAGAPPAVRARLRVVLVAPDRLGVLHDVTAALHAAAAHGLAIAAIALAPPLTADLSTGTNAAELAARAPSRGRAIVTLPHASVTDLATDARTAERRAALG
jgi:dethiobiotin synthetase